MLNCSNNLLSKMQKISTCKNSSRRVKRPKSFTTTKLSKLIWIHLVIAIALFQQTVTLLSRPLKFINNCFWLAMTFKFVIAPWSGYS